MMFATVDEIYTRFAAGLPDEQLAREVGRTQRVMSACVRTRKDIARRKLYCLQCELKRRASQRDVRNPGLG